MTTEVHNGANGTVKSGEVEPLEEIKSKIEPVKPVDLVESGNANGKIDGEALEEKEEPLQEKAATNRKGEVEGKENVVEDAQEGGNHYSSEEEEAEAEAEGEEDDREEEGGQYEDDEEEYVEDEEEEDEEDEDDEEPAPPTKRRK